MSTPTIIAVAACVVTLVAFIGLFFASKAVKDASHRADVAETDQKTAERRSKEANAELIASQKSLAAQDGRVVELGDVIDGLSGELKALHRRFDDLDGQFRQPGEIDTKAAAAQSGLTAREVRKNFTNGDWPGRKVYDRDRMTWVVQSNDIPTAPQSEIGDA